VTAPPARRRLALTDDGIIDPVAVEIAARGIRPVALTRAERQLAAVRILARGGTPNLVARRLHVSGTTALTLAATSAGRARTNEQNPRGAGLWPYGEDTWPAAGTTRQHRPPATRVRR
jgi:hypothetical protein